MKDLISIIVPVYNVEDYLERCLDSLVNQTYKNIEIIVVVDGSKDNSLNIAKRFAEKHKRVKVFYKENSGQADSRKYGFNESKGNYIAFVDSDDWVELDYCEYLYNLLQKNKSDISCCGFCFDDQLREMTEDLINVDRKNIFKEYFNNDRIKTPVWNKLYKREILTKFDLVDKIARNGEDVIFTCNALLNARNVVASRKQKYHYNISNISTTRSVLTKEKIDENIYAHNKQIKLIKNKYKNNKFLIEKSYEKLANTLVNMFYSMALEVDNNHNKEYVKKILKKYYYKFIKSKYINKKIKIRVILVNRLSWLYNFYIKKKNYKN